MKSLNYWGAAPKKSLPSTIRCAQTQAVKGRRQRSEGEEEFLRQIRDAGLPLPEREFHYAKHLGYRFRADFYWGPPHSLVWEVSGAVWRLGAHTSGSGVTRDHLKTSIAAALGYRVGMSTTDQVFDKSGLYWLACALGIHSQEAADIANSLPVPEKPRTPVRKRKPKKARKSWRAVMRRVVG